jgi:uncharacterized protein (TIGR00730 family)
MSAPMRSLCVFAGSSIGARPDYARAAAELGACIAGRGWTVVYGGASVGLMGVLADAALAAGGRVVGVIPEALLRREVAHPGLTELRVVVTMHERKALMAELSGGVVALPGGFGTLEEFFEMLTWAQLGFHEKPCGLLNAGGYFDPLLAFLDRTVEERFVRPAHRELIVSRDSAGDLLDALTAYVAEPVDKWFDRAEPGR